MDSELINKAHKTGTDAEFRAWVQKQRSCVSGRFSEYLGSGEGRCIAAHVRRVAHGAGTGCKPPFSAVPLTHGEHLKQHQHGESFFGPPDWWEAQAEHYLRHWIDVNA